MRTVKGRKVAARRPEGFPVPGPTLTDKNPDGSETYRTYEEWITDYIAWRVDRVVTEELNRRLKRRR